MNTEERALPSLGADHRRYPGFWAVIPAGGSGTRLWPLSRASRPKFLLPLLGTRSLLQHTYDRLSPLADPEHMLVVCGTAHAATVTRQLPDLPTPGIVVEPLPKGSGPAIGLAAAIIARRDPAAIMGSFAADHDVRDHAAFQRAVDVAIQIAQEGWLVTIGLNPSRPETGYGYIERTEEKILATDLGDAYRSARFIEKPDLARATSYVESGRFLWNASMFVWRVDALLAEMKRLQPDLHEALLRIADAWESPEQERVMAEVWATLPESTIDQGIMEQAFRVAVVPADLGWSDIGDWDGLARLVASDAEGNTARVDLLQVATTNSSVWSETDRLIALVGIDNVTVVDTADALLVVNRGRAQEVRSIVELLKQRARTEHV